MPNAVPQAFRDAAYPEETGTAFVLLLKIEHEDLDAPIYLTDAGGTYDSVLDTYTFMVGTQAYICAPIEIEPPGDSEEEPRGRLRVPNVDQRIGEVIDQIATAAICTVTAVLENSPTTIVGGPHRFLRLQSVRGDAMVMEGDLMRVGLTGEPWPRDAIRAGKFTAAFRI